MVTKWCGMLDGRSLSCHPATKKTGEPRPANFVSNIHYWEVRARTAYYYMLSLVLAISMGPEAGNFNQSKKPDVPGNLLDLICV